MLKIGKYEFNSRLLMGTGKFSSYSLMRSALLAAKSELVTLAFKRVEKDRAEDILSYLNLENVALLPNTSGVRTAAEAVLVAELARAATGSDLIKLEIHPDPRYLLPDPVETLTAAAELVKQGFTVFPYIQADPVLCKRLEDVGVQCVMPLGAPIGSNQGLKTKAMLEIIIEESQVPVIIDAGLGAPSHAAESMELGADAVLVNTAIAIANDPIKMAEAFQLAVTAGRIAYEMNLNQISSTANASSPMDIFS